MSRKKRVMLIAAICVIVGALLCVAAMASVGFDLNNLNTTQYRTRTIDITEKFSDISISAGSTDVCILPSDDGVCSVVSVEEPDAPNSASVENGALIVAASARGGHWYESIGINFGVEAWPSVTIYLPESVYGDLSCKTAGGDVSAASGLTFAAADITTDSGEVCFDASAVGEARICTASGDVTSDGASANTLLVRTTSGGVRVTSPDAAQIELHSTSSDVSLTDASMPGMLTAETTSGDITITRAKASSASVKAVSGDVSALELYAVGRLSVQTTSGEISLTHCDGDTLALTSASGDVSGSLTSYKNFSVRTTSGDVDVPPSVLDAGACDIQTTSGDVSLAVSAN